MVWAIALLLLTTSLGVRHDYVTNFSFATDYWPRGGSTNMAWNGDTEDRALLDDDNFVKTVEGLNTAVTDSALVCFHGIQGDLLPDVLTSRVHYISGFEFRTRTNGMAEFRRRCALKTIPGDEPCNTYHPAGSSKAWDGRADRTHGGDGELFGLDFVTLAEFQESTFGFCMQAEFAGGFFDVDDAEIYYCGFIALHTQPCSPIEGCSDVQCTTQLDSACYSCDPLVVVATASGASGSATVTCDGINGTLTATNGTVSGDDTFPSEVRDGIVCSAACPSGLLPAIPTWTATCSGVAAGSWDFVSEQELECSTCPPVDRCIGEVTCTTLTNSICDMCEAGSVPVGTPSVCTDIATETSTGVSGSGSGAEGVIAAGTTANEDDGGGAGVAIGVVIALLCICGLAGGIAAFVFLRQRKPKHSFNDHDDGATVKVSTAHVGAMIEKLLAKKSTSVVGRGGGGQVYKCKMDNGKWIAVKKLNQETPAAVAEFHEEVTILSKFQAEEHPNVILLLFFCTTPSHSMAMEIALNGTLCEYYRKNPNIPVAVKLDLVKGVAHGLAFIHSMEFAHLDIKTRNILLVEDLTPKICDFGISQSINSSPRNGMVECTPQYAAPERLLGTVREGWGLLKVDVYAFAMLMMALWLQEEPHGGETASFVTDALINDVDLRPKLDESAPSNYNTVIIQCWATKPKERPSMEEVVSQIEKWSDEEALLGSTMSIAFCGSERTENLDSRILDSQSLSSMRSVNPNNENSV